jgi:hypothetical protein
MESKKKIIVLGVFSGNNSLCRTIWYFYFQSSTMVRKEERGKRKEERGERRGERREERGEKYTLELSIESADRCKKTKGNRPPTDW